MGYRVKAAELQDILNEVPYVPASDHELVDC